MRTKKLIGTQFACFNTTKAGFCVRPTLDLLAKMFETSVKNKSSRGQRIKIAYL